MTGPIRITDGDLHCYLLGAGASGSIAGLADLLASQLRLGVRAHTAAILAERARRNGSDDWESDLLSAFYVCPRALAERMLEATVLYRQIGSRFLPDLLPLALVLLRADLHAYATPSKKPYRDHLAHQTRVAALAHMLLDGRFPLARWASFVTDRLERWHYSAEAALLAEHLGCLGLEEGLVRDADEVREAAQSAALLAGLVHDIGYSIGIEASFGDPTVALDRMGIFPASPIDDPPRAPVTELYRRFYADSRPGEALCSFRSYVERHPTSPHSVAGSLWLAYLPERLRREGLVATPENGRHDGRRAAGRFELICQLGAMMALCHDFPIDSPSKAEATGFKVPRGYSGESLLDRYPLSALFATADMLHEFGRPILGARATSVEVHAPVLGLVLSESGPQKLEISWAVARRPVGAVAPKHPGTVVHKHVGDLGFTGFDFARLGSDVPKRLRRWGMDEILFQRFPDQADASRRSRADLARHPLTWYEQTTEELREAYGIWPLVP